MRLSEKKEGKAVERVKERSASSKRLRKCSSKDEIPNKDIKGLNAKVKWLERRNLVRITLLIIYRNTLTVSRRSTSRNDKAKLIFTLSKNRSRTCPSKSTLIQIRQEAPPSTISSGFNNLNSKYQSSKPS